MTKKARIENKAFIVSQVTPADGRGLPPCLCVAGIREILFFPLVICALQSENDFSCAVLFFVFVEYDLALRHPCGGFSVFN